MKLLFHNKEFIVLILIIAFLHLYTFNHYQIIFDIVYPFVIVLAALSNQLRFVITKRNFNISRFNFKIIKYFNNYDEFDSYVSEYYEISREDRESIKKVYDSLMNSNT